MHHLEGAKAMHRLEARAQASGEEKSDATQGTGPLKDSN
jgi:hypothetical protein